MDGDICGLLKELSNLRLEECRVLYLGDRWLVVCFLLFALVASAGAVA